MEVTDRNFVIPLHESVTQRIDFHIQHNSEFRTRIEIAGFDFRGFIEGLSSDSGFGIVAAFFSEMYQFTFGSYCCTASQLDLSIG
jgi:hypothetical protein